MIKFYIIVCIAVESIHHFPFHFFNNAVLFIIHVALEDGFICPKLLPSEFVKDPNPKYPHPTNCQKYYVCLKGVTPVEQSCYPGEVFNNNSK
jgi:hypothetical protein